MSAQAALSYRPCVGVMLVNSEGRVFVGKRIDNREGDAWQMPQGGIDDGEAPRDAALRELTEETGLAASHVAVIAQMREEITYDLPEDLAGRLWGGRFRGQRQQWFLVRLTGADSDIDLDAHDPAEFCEWKWVEPDELPDLIVPFKKRVYRSVLEEFRTLI